MLEIRRFFAADVEIYQRQLYQLWLQLVERQPADLRDLFKIVSMHACHMLVVVDTQQDRVVAMGSVMVTPPVGTITDVVVHEACRGRGVGRALMQRLHTVARERGCIQCQLRARPAPRGFYRRLGYVQQARSELFVCTLQRRVP